MRLSPTKDEDLGTLNVIHKLILPHSKESKETMSKLFKSVKKTEPGSCLDLTCGGGEHSCEGPSCVWIESFQKEDLATWFGDITEKEKSEVQIVAEAYMITTVNIAKALGFFSRMCTLQSLEMLESGHYLVTALSVDSWPGALQKTHKHIRVWKIDLEAEMVFTVSEAYSLPVNAESLCGSHYLLHIAIQPEDTNRQSLLGIQMRMPGSNVASFAQTVEKGPVNFTGEQRDNLSEIWE